MGERLKYTLNGVYRCENFAQHLAIDDFPSKRIGSAGGFDDWFIQLETHSNNMMSIYPFIFSNTFNKKLKVKCMFCVRRKDGSIIRTISKHIEIDEGPYGLDMNVAELLNEKNEYLDNGALVIEYGFQVESILGNDKIWRFNNKDPLFDYEEKKNMIRFPGTHMGRFDFQAHKQLLTLHSSFFYRKCQKVDGNLMNGFYVNDSYMRGMENIVQIAQGVQLKHLTAGKLTRVMSFGLGYSMQNVVCYCERQLIENDLKFENMKQWVSHWYRLRHYLVHMLKNVKSPREMIDENDIEKMQGEAMKIFIAKFLYDKF